MNLRGRVKKLERVLGPMKTSEHPLAHLSDAELDAEIERVMRELAAADPDTGGPELARFLDAKARGPNALADYISDWVQTECGRLGIDATPQKVAAFATWSETRPEMFDEGRVVGG